jgi:hypothetical protein
MSGGLETQVRGIAGQWPTAPAVWSFSSIAQARACPRQWALMNGKYPAVWDGRGYPPKPSESALVGQVLHSCLEEVVWSFKRLNCLSARDPRSVEALRSCGGYSTLIRKAIERVLDPMRENPRMSHRVDDLRESLVRRSSELRSRVQMLVSKVDLGPHQGEASVEPFRTSSYGGELGPGSYAELRLTALSLRMTGVADLVRVTEEACQIFDYKSGSEHDHHETQLHTYQTLWTHDTARNSSGRSVDRMEIIYPARTRSVRPLGESEMDIFAASLRRQVADADGAVTARPPEAIVTSDNCEFCPVRHLCDDYWESELVAVLPEDGFSDAQLVIEEERGERTWRVRHEASDVSTLMQAPSSLDDFQAGDVLRVLNAAAAPAEVDEPPLLNLTRASEYYVLNVSVS